MISSIETGSAPGQTLEDNLVDLARRLAAIVTETEENNNMFGASHQKLVNDNHLFLLNVYHGVEAVGLEEHQAIDRKATYTDTDFNNPDVIRLIQSCVRSMEAGGQRLSPVTQDGPLL